MGGLAPLEIDVVAVDLNVNEAFPKAQRIAAFSVDTRRLHGDNGLRIVIEAPTENNSAVEAQQFLRYHGEELGYQVFDYGDPRERKDFIMSAIKEVSGDGDRRLEMATISTDFVESLFVDVPVEFPRLGPGV